LNTYPAILFTARYGRRIAAAVAAVIALVGMIASYLCSSLVGTALTLACAIAAWAVLRVLAELIEVIADTLLPR
jgi:Na+/proline symporter